MRGSGRERKSLCWAQRRRNKRVKAKLWLVWLTRSRAKCLLQVYSPQRHSHRPTTRHHFAFRHVAIVEETCIKMRTKDELSNFAHWMVVGVRQAGLSETSHLLQHSFLRVWELKKRSQKRQQSLDNCLLQRGIRKSIFEHTAGQTLMPTAVGHAMRRFSCQPTLRNWGFNLLKLKISQ